MIAAALITAVAVGLATAWSAPVCGIGVLLFGLINVLVINVVCFSRSSA
jgi:hypothetical protein